ncbi:MAG: PRC-barrel domain-containing protein [Candidatus Saccharibacteria bacterium]|nr:PRC-barrel domain-containing protein [Candidatus Saccharibacteria bacterium]
MLVSGNRLIGTPILSMQAAGQIATISSAIIDPDTLKILGFKLSGPLIAKSSANILDVKSIREYSRYGCIIDNIDELVEKDDVIKIKKVLDLNFDLLGLKVETKKGSKLGRVSDFTVTSEDFMIQQIIVRRPALKALIDPELTIPRREIVEITDYKVIIKDEEKAIKERAEKEDFIPNFVNPFRKNGEFAPSDKKD